MSLIINLDLRLLRGVFKEMRMCLKIFILWGIVFNIGCDEKDGTETIYGRYSRNEYSISVFENGLFESDRFPKTVIINGNIQVESINNGGGDWRIRRSGSSKILELRWKIIDGNKLHFNQQVVIHGSGLEYIIGDPDLKRSIYLRKSE